jgi:hypothetical protein
MKNFQPFVPPDIADRMVSNDDIGARAQGAKVVAIQIRNSLIFSRWLWFIAVVSVGSAVWLRWWIPIVFGVVFLALKYFNLIFMMSLRVTRSGMLPEYQGAYKRLYYRDLQFKSEVDQLLARKVDLTLGKE